MPSGRATHSRAKRAGSRRARLPGQATAPATLADIARLAGVVPMTASRAINQSGYVSVQVRRRVMRAAQKLNYRPNVLARRLKGQRLRAVGIMLPDIANPFSAELVAGIQQILEAAGYTIFIATSNRSVLQEKAGLHAFVDHRVDGVVVATRGTQIGNETITELARRRIPVVTVGRPIERSAVDYVTADHWKGSFHAVRHLIELGHRRIGFLGINHEDSRMLRRFQGYAAALEAAGLPLIKELIAGPDGGPAYATQDDGYNAMLRLAQIRERPTAVFARNDYTAIGAMRAAHEMGLSVPGDLAIAGFDNIPLAAFATPPLTTVEQPIAAQGRQAARFLLERMEGRYHGKRQSVCFDCRLIIRGSTNPTTSGTSNLRTLSKVSGGRG